jgi:hypothetical protein
MPEGVAIDGIGRNVYITDSTEGKTLTSKRPAAAGAATAAASLSKSTMTKTGSWSNPGTIKARVGSSAPRIIVCSADGSMCHALITSRLDKPRERDRWGWANESWRRGYLYMAYIYISIYISTVLINCYCFMVPIVLSY